ncbi:protein GREB1 [Hoplias malabaricus]|uniref:protein GREB1 n=1 Tax=Hoplias malabaricus TaxID=27720 RepID=UPI00346238D8
MGNSYAGQLRTTRFEEVLHSSIEASLRSNSVVPRPVFSQLYLEPEHRTHSRDGHMENEEEDDEDGSESSSPPIPYQMKPPPEGSCIADGFCQAGKDLRLSSVAAENLDVPAGFLLVGAKSPSLPEHVLVCAVDRRFLPDERGHNALLGFLGNCVGCGEKGFRYFTEFSNHINLKLSTQPKKQKHLKYRLLRNAQGLLVQGPAICWKGIESRVKQIPPVSSGLEENPHGSGSSDFTLHSSAHSHTASYTDLNSHLQASETSPPIANGSHAPESQPALPQTGFPAAHATGRTPGSMVSSGPPKKRHRGWSPESSTTTETANRPACSTMNGSKSVDSSSSGCVSQESSPQVPPRESVTVPENLLQTCGLQPVIFKGHGVFPHLCGNTTDVHVSESLQVCYRSSQTLPRVYEQFGAASVQPLSTEMQILLTVYYLVQLGPDQVPLIDDLEQILIRSWRESHLTEIRQFQQNQNQTQFPPPLPGLAHPLSPSQLPWLAKLAASSGDSLLVLDTFVSIAPALDHTFLSLMEGRLSHTHYIVIICMNRNQETESCVMVTGKHQSRAFAESMLSRSECVGKISQELSSGLTAELEAYFSSLGPDGNVEALLEKLSPENSSNSTPELSGESTCSEFRVQWHEVRPVQLAVARKLLSHVCAIADSSTHNLDLGSFDRVDFLICVPPSEVTFRQVVLHLWNSGVLQELGLDQDSALCLKDAEQFVVKLDQAAVSKINDLIQKSKLNPYTLFILVHDHAHWDISSGQYGRVGGELNSGLVDSLLNCRQIQEANNILILHVTSFPFALQTQYTRISPYNEIHWPSLFNNDVDLYNEKMKYFGMSELLESTCSGNGVPLLRFDSSFESIVTALEERFPKLHSVVIRTLVLLRHYSIALLAAARGGGQVQLQKHTSVETMEMVQSLLGSAQRCPTHGHMILLRIPIPSLASLAHQRLRRIRNQLGLHHCFDIVLADPASGITVGTHFLKQLRAWLNIQDPDWTPQTYLELEALPCILIFTGFDPMGESLPRSLKYCDHRVLSCCALQRTVLEQELGFAAYLVSAEPQNLRQVQTSTDLFESDPDKLSSTDNEDDELAVEMTHTIPDHSQTESSPRKPDPTLPPHPPPGRDTPQGQRHSSLSPSPISSSPQVSPLRRTCSWARDLARPPAVLLPKSLYDIITTVDSSGLPKSTSFLPHVSVEWVSSFRPLLSKIMTCTEQSLYYRQWTMPRAHHMDSSNRADGRTDNFHPRRLLLSGPPQVGKTGAYLQFLGILSRMLIRLMEVDIYDEEDINCSSQSDAVGYHQAMASWPSADILRGMPFDFTIHNPKYKDISPIYSPEFTPNVEKSFWRQEDIYRRRRTARIKLSKYAAYNTYHHCEQCHQYMGFNPRYQLYESSLHAFTFSHLLLGEDIQLYFIIPKSKEHHFSFNQSGGQLESMRLPLTSDWNPDCIKSPIFTPTTGRHEHGLFNLYHAMDGAAHLHILVIKEYEMAVYKKYWPNHIMLVLPTIFNGAGIGAAHFLIKELSYHNLELERSRRVELGNGQDVWPFIVLADDSCVMWNRADIDPNSGVAGAERNVSLKQVLQHMESSPNVSEYGVCGVRKWSSGDSRAGCCREPFSRGHLHDFILLNVDLTKEVQYNQNRFTCDDVDFNLRVQSAGLLMCRFNNFSVMKKQIAIGGYRTFIIKTKMTDVTTTVQPSQYICAPDSKHVFLATPAQLLLEKYLQQMSQQLFPLSAGNYTHPVLSVDCYLNLGPEVTVCFVSSRPHSVNVSSVGLLFGGLLLYFCESYVTPGFLKKFHFLKGATLCVICPNRNALRQTVVRLELEDEWRFRLSDEFQTANAKEDQPIFFLTGKHI